MACTAAIAICSIRSAEKTDASLSGGGIFGVELFVTKDGSVLLNEIAPRPHNSGHYTQDGICATDQFEQHLRCVLDLPLGSTEMRVPTSTGHCAVKRSKGVTRRSFF